PTPATAPNWSGGSAGSGTGTAFPAVPPGRGIPGAALRCATSWRAPRGGFGGSRRRRRPPGRPPRATAGDTRRPAGQGPHRGVRPPRWGGRRPSPLTRPRETRDAGLGRDSGRTGWPQLILRIGYGLPVTASPRRPVRDVLEERSPGKYPE